MTRNNLLYFHRADNLYAPFHIDYFKVPSDYDENGCTYLLSSNDTLSIDKPPKAYDPNFNPGEFCHIRLERPIAGTSLLRFTNVSLNTDSFWDNQGRCYDMDTFIEISSSIDQPWPFATRFCNSTLRNATNFSVAVTHEKFDIFVYQQANDQVKFNLTVQFLPCGGYYNGPDGGFIASPGYNNGSYPANTQCIWSFKAPEAKVVKLKIVDMNLEHSYECKHDYLRVYEGGGTDASLIHIYCNNDQMEPLQERFQDVKSKGRYLTLYFVSDGTIQMKGFKIEYSFIGFDDECGFSTNSLNGTILSPGSPKDYPNGASCLWDISVPHGYHIALMFNRFDVQKSDKCAKDSVKISQEHQTRAVEPHGQYYFLFDHEEEAKIYCGYENPESYHSESPRIKIRFVSDERITGKGFNITWKAECGGIYRLNHGVITSPHYPSFYPNIDSRCDYLIDPEYEGVPIIVLKIQDFDLDGANVAFDRRPCQSDYLEIRDVFQSRVVNTLCVGRNDKGEFPPISIKGPVGIRFQSNTSFFYGEPKRKPFRGFKISYALSKCGGEINLKNADSGMSEKISSPGFPLPYHHDLKCIWNISAPSERIINVKYLDFDLEDASGCHFDYLELFDGAEISNVTSMGRLCGSRVPPNQVSSSSNWMIIKFVSDRSLSKGGFKLVVTATVGPKQGCGGNLTAEGNWKELKAPIDQDTGTYYNYLRCGWVIKAPPKKIIQIQITEFELEEPVMQSWGCFDYLSIYDGYKTISPFLMSNTCKITEELPLSMYSSYRVVFVYFESDSGTARKGFNLEYRAIDAFCGGNYIAESYRKELSYESEKMLTRTSPKRQRCRFIIYSTQKMPIRVEFSRFSFPSDTVHCQDEYMEIRDAGSPTECHHPACTSGREFLKTIRVCGSSRPADFISGTSIVQITTSAILQSEHTSKFDLKYQILSDCNRTIDVYEKMTGRITSPNYPNPYDHNSSCTTVLQAIEGYRIFLVFKEFRLERARRRPGVRPMSLRDVVNLRRGISIVENIISRYGNLPWKEECEYDYVQIMNTGSNDAKRYCDFKIPPPQLSTNNTLIIYFKSDGTMAPIGYDAYYYVSKPAKSGSAVYYDFGTIGEFQGAIENIGFPGYPPATRMRWRIEPPNGHKCTLSFMKMDFGIYENGQCVNGDHMVMAEYNHKDPLENSPLLYLPCRNATTYPHRVTLLPGTNVLLEFFTDDDQSNDGEGFRLQWECENYYVPQA
ncbi:hypothetical protein AB6A40_004618 [Gnathostoma spinigerum]|uniref:CUB domain-containing protein n=1 Tax=Gnathostoma spinigerum TaxID=75299 RepID=A0ABD6ED07_9BILA